MNSVSSYIVYFLIVVLLQTSEILTEIIGGPQHVVGVVHRTVTLNCSSSPGQRVQWSFIQLGKTTVVNESSIPGTTRGSWSDNGQHTLTLENVQFENSGEYRCRVLGDASDLRDAAAAYVVIVADPPHCSVNQVQQEVTLNCSVVYLSQFNVTLQWSDAVDGQVMASKNYPADQYPQVARLKHTIKPSELSAYNHEYICTLFFNNMSQPYIDIADNEPILASRSCSVSLDLRLTTTQQEFSTSLLNTADSTLKITIPVIVSLSIIILVIITVVICIRRRRSKIRTGFQSCLMTCSRVENRTEETPLSIQNSTQNTTTTGTTTEKESSSLLAEHATPPTPTQVHDYDASAFTSQCTTSSSEAQEKFGDIADKMTPSSSTQTAHKRERPGDFSTTSDATTADISNSLSNDNRVSLDSAVSTTTGTSPVSETCKTYSDDGWNSAGRREVTDDDEPDRKMFDLRENVEDEEDQVG